MKGWRRRWREAAENAEAARKSAEGRRDSLGAAGCAGDLVRWGLQAQAKLLARQLLRIWPRVYLYHFSYQYMSEFFQETERSTYDEGMHSYSHY